MKNFLIHSPVYSKKWMWLFTFWASISILVGSITLGGFGFFYYMLYLPWSAYDGIHYLSEWKSINADTLSFSKADDFVKAEQSLLLKVSHPKDLKDQVIPYFLLGNLYEVTDRKTESIGAYEKVISLVSNDTGFYTSTYFKDFLRRAQIELAILHYQTGEFEKSKKILNDIDDLESLEPNDMGEKLPLANALKNMYEDETRADKHFQLAIQLQHLLKLHEAKQEYEKTIALCSDPALKTLAQSYLKVKMPKNDENIKPMALYYIKAGDLAESNTDEQTTNLEKAAKLYQQAIQMSPDFEWAYYHLGNVYRQLGKFNKSIEYENKALTLNSNFFLPYLTLGDIALDNKEYKTAVDFYQKALALTAHLTNTDDNVIIANIQNQLGYAFEQSHEIDKAKEHYQNALGLLDKNFKMMIAEDLSEDESLDENEEYLSDLRAKSEDYQYASESLERLKGA